MGYLVVAGAVLAIIGSDIRRDHRACSTKPSR
jgi:hypothetical protein